ncbi:FecR family protein [Pedobacter frigoris]|uniref:FecR family protein n=1 Tax=Pedobacter frigoris TaxID=2571272 RepID=UPI00292FAB5A|nr:FecR family protein [Pedobacter frigoris]
MMSDFDKQEELLEKYKNGLCTPQEEALVEHWYNTQSALTKDMLPEPSYVSSRDEIREAISLKIEENKRQGEKPIRIIRIKSLLVAASLFLLTVVGVYYFVYSTSADKEQYALKNKPDIKPGRNKAYLTLSNGKRIELSDSTIGTLAMQSGVQITKTADGQLIYKVTGEDAADSDKPNLLEAPKGGQYQIVLIDGTKVWLNSSSVLKYPARFSGSERKVELIGEAYFEVAKNKKQPFRIISGDQEIEVLGTHFNVNAYTDEENIKTTLIEGSVKVYQTANKEIAKILKPGQQSVLQLGTFDINNVDTEEAVAWKNGYFIFENDDINLIMRKLARWYDIEVVNKGANNNKTKIMGAIARNTNLSEVLQLFEETGKFKFKMEGRRITIMQ